MKNGKKIAEGEYDEKIIEVDTMGKYCWFKKMEVLG